MPAKIYKIVLDTNFIYYDKSYGLGTLFSDHLEQLVEFIKTNNLSNVQIFLPEMVIKERVAQKVAQTEVFRKESFAALKSLETIDLKVGNKKFEKTNLEKAFKKKVDAIVSANNIGIIPIPNVKNSEIVKRALAKTPPFSQKGDAGYKDTVIWLSVMEDAKKSPEAQYIFCTNNTNDFITDICTKEFRNTTGASIYFVPDLNELKLLLDKELVLKLDLKQLNERITDEIRRHLGDLNIEFNKFLKRDKDPFDVSMRVSLMAYDYISGYNKDNGVKAYNALNFNPTNIDQKRGQVFNIEGSLEVQEVKEKPKGGPFDFDSATYTSVRSYRTQLVEEWDINFTWNDRTKSITSFFAAKPYRRLGSDSAWSIN